MLSVQIRRKSTICKHKKLLVYISKTKELIVDFRKKEAKRHTLVDLSGAEVEQVDSFRSSQRLCHGSTSYWNWRKVKFRCQVLAKFCRGAKENTLTGNITNWHWWRTAPDGICCSAGDQNCLEDHWHPSAKHEWHCWSEMSEQSPKDTKKWRPPQPQSVHPAATWEETQRNPLPYHQTTEQLLFSDREAPELIIFVFCLFFAMLLKGQQLTCPCTTLCCWMTIK